MFSHVLVSQILTKIPYLDLKIFTWRFGGTIEKEFSSNRWLQLTISHSPGFVITYYLTPLPTNSCPCWQQWRHGIHLSFLISGRKAFFFHCIQRCSAVLFLKCGGNRISTCRVRKFDSSLSQYIRIDPKWIKELNIRNRSLWRNSYRSQFLDFVWKIKARLLLFSSI